MTTSAYPNKTTLASALQNMKQTNTWLKETNSSCSYNPSASSHPQPAVSLPPSLTRCGNPVTSQHVIALAATSGWADDCLVTLYLRLRRGNVFRPHNNHCSQQYLGRLSYPGQWQHSRGSDSRVSLCVWYIILRKKKIISEKQENEPEIPTVYLLAYTCRRKLDMIMKVVRMATNLLSWLHVLGQKG